MVSEPASSPIVAKPIRQGDAFPAGALRTELDPEFAKRAGQRIWQSECEGTKLGLTSWNEGEDFASLGIGHFLWFPKDKEFEFEESFPEFLDYYRSLPASEPMPDWLTMAVDCPWANRDEFLGARDDKRMIELREFLFATVPEQTRFVYRRLLASRSKILELASPEKRNHLDDRFAALSRTTEGQYAMMDYVNFKGEGTNPKERYEGQGWGLFQVLETMNPALRERDAVVDFSRAAEAMLRRRVENHPEDARWIEGWSHRTRAYSQPFEALP
ncbi:MAG: hypothetical protein H7A53_09605 [Akkermansiaceae bacterium]|nr:hypothetical protein [Akkermansiaceae bacterium]MCP5551133.1 hypothetical protein [Akkermansiaceae bacterium]